MKKVCIIAEAGVNHNGSVERALAMVDAAADAGVDMVKFQTCNPEAGISRCAPKAAYQQRTTGTTESQLEMMRKLLLTEDDHRTLLKRCARKNLAFLSTPFDIGSIDFLVSLNVPILKIPSGEVVNLPYLRRAGASGKEIILSTGMATLEEVAEACDILTAAGTPKKKIILLHCNTEYPTPYEDVNLRAMVTMRDRLGVRVGYSDHTPGIVVPVAAVALGAVVVEKHFTLDKKLPGPDQSASIEPNELRAMVSAIRNTEAALGSEIKQPSPSEKKNIVIARKSIVAAVAIAKGEQFTERNLAVKRPGDGISPMAWDTVIGQTAKQDFGPDEKITV